MSSYFLQQFNQAKHLKAQGKYEAALSILLQLSKNYPQHAAVFNQLGTIYFAKHRFFEASTLFQTAIALQPDLIEALYNLGLALSKLGEKHQAIAAYQKILAYQNNHDAAHFQLGCLFMNQDDYQSAIAHFIQIPAAEDLCFEININLAICFMKTGRLEQAKKYYLHAYALRSNDLQVLFNLGVTYSQLQEPQEAAKYYHLLLHHYPSHCDTHYNLGLLYKTQGNTRIALHHLHEALLTRPGDEKIQYLIATLTGSHPEQAPPAAYVQSLFDFYAPHYDETLEHDLKYQVPHLIFNAWDKLVQEKNKLNAILDLGCGTGLCGQLFKPWAASLTGIDLSGTMLEKLAQKHLYDQLIQADICDFLLKNTKKYDLVLMGDVLVYFSDVSRLFSAITQALQPQGLFIVTAEAGKSCYQRQISGRFAHSQDYLEKTACAAGLTPLFYQEVTLRVQHDEMAAGHLCVFRT